MSYLKNGVLIEVYLKVVGREGFEPSTNGLKVHCSTN